MLKLLKNADELALSLYEFKNRMKKVRKLEFLSRGPEPMKYTTLRSIAGHICNKVANSEYSFSKSVTPRLSIKTWGCGEPESISMGGFNKLSEDEKDNYRRVNIFSLPDLILQQLVAEYIGEKISDRFSESCVAYRKKLGQPAAVSKISQYTSKGEYWVVRLDVKSFNETVHHDVLRRFLKQALYTKIPAADREIVKGTVKALCMFGTMVTGKNKRGLVVGSPLTPVLTNLYLSPLDSYLDRKKIPFVRYGDDLAVFCSSKAEAESILAGLVEILKTRLKQKPSYSPNSIPIIEKLHGAVGKPKTAIMPPGEDFDFVGFNFKGDAIKIRHETYRKIKRKIEKLTHLRGDRIIKDAERQENPTLGTFVTDEACNRQEPVPSVYYLFRKIAGINRLLGFKYESPLGLLMADTRVNLKFYPEFSLPFQLLRLASYDQLKDQFYKLDRYLHRRTMAFHHQLGVYENYSDNDDKLIWVDLRKMGLMTFKDVANRFPKVASEKQNPTPPAVPDVTMI